MMLRPTPRSRLTQSVSYSQLDDSGHDNVYGAAVAISYVHYEENATLIRDNNGNILKGATMLYYDEVNSSPKGIVFREGDKVTVGTKTLKVVATTSLLGHHQEVILQ